MTSSLHYQMEEDHQSDVGLYCKIDDNPIIDNFLSPEVVPCSSSSASSSDNGDNDDDLSGISSVLSTTSSNATNSTKSSSSRQIRRTTSTNFNGNSNATTSFMTSSTKSIVSTMPIAGLDCDDEENQGNFSSLHQIPSGSSDCVLSRRRKWTSNESQGAGPRIGLRLTGSSDSILSSTSTSTNISRCCGDEENTNDQNSRCGYGNEHGTTHKKRSPLKSVAEKKNIAQSLITHQNHKRKKLSERSRKSPKIYIKNYRLKILQILSGLYIIVLTFTPVGTFRNIGGLVDPDTGFIIDIESEENTRNGVIEVNNSPRAIVAESAFQMVSLGISRFSAYSMYPVIVFVFLTKLRATMNYVSQTYISLFTSKDIHDLHVYCGWYILIDSWIHTVFHTARWWSQGNLDLLVKSPSGVSGIMMILSLCLICLPMTICRAHIRYEIRKRFHYLFIVFALAFCFHAPVSAFPNGGFAPIILGILLSWYALDSIYVLCFMTEKIQSPIFHVLPSGVQLTMSVSERFRAWGVGGYCYICLPWVSETQWHAFSLFENPVNPEERQIFMQKCGDWTNDVHEYLKRETSRPVWIRGPFASPYGNADNYDNQILVAGGIGITPALSVIRNLKDTRRCSLIWATRDRHMLEFFIKHADLSPRGWNLVFYTGKEPLIGFTDFVLKSNGAKIHIIRARPQLQFIISNIIYGIESGESKPEDFIADNKIEAMERLRQKLITLESENAGLTSQEKLSKLVNYCDELGYLFSDLISTLPIFSKDSSFVCLRSSLASLKNNEIKDEESMMSSDKVRIHNEDALKSTLMSLNKDGKINEQVLDAILRFGMKSLRHSESLRDFFPFKPWEVNEGAEEYVQALDENEVICTWGLLYCGGKTPLESAVKEEALKFKIEMHTESFMW